MATKGKKITIEKLKLNQIKLGKNSRLNIRTEELEGMMQSIKELGLLQPIGVVKLERGSYEICYGNRRFLACSKLGMTTIPAIVHENKDESEIDMKNLAENIQRRSISLTEAGRYIEGLLKMKLTPKEISVRLGVTIGYVNSCIRAYESVPKEFQKHIETNVTGAGKHDNKKRKGKISLATVSGIANATGKFNLSQAQVSELYTAAKENPGFQPQNIPEYALAVKQGKEIDDVMPLRHINFTSLITSEHYDELEVKWITNGPFKSITQLFKAILKGEKAVKIELKELPSTGSRIAGKKWQKGDDGKWKNVPVHTRKAEKTTTT